MAYEVNIEVHYKVQNLPLCTTLSPGDWQESRTLVFPRVVIGTVVLVGEITAVSFPIAAKGLADTAACTYMHTYTHTHTLRMAFSSNNAHQFAEDVKKCYERTCLCICR